MSEFDLYSQDSFGQIQESSGKLFEIDNFGPPLAYQWYARGGPKHLVFRCLIFELQIGEDEEGS